MLKPLFIFCQVCYMCLSCLSGCGHWTMQVGCSWARAWLRELLPHELRKAGIPKKFTAFLCCWSPFTQSFTAANKSSELWTRRTDCLLIQWSDNCASCEMDKRHLAGFASFLNELWVAALSRSRCLLYYGWCRWGAAKHHMQKTRVTETKMKSICKGAENPVSAEPDCQPDFCP